MKVKFVSFDSMGVRSMATVVETSAGLIFIDPGAALAPRRYGLPPHDLEIKALSRYLSDIYEYVRISDYIVITHYHRDHYLYRLDEGHLYRGKVLLVKNPYVNINPSQKIRAYVLFKKMNVEEVAKEVNYVDGQKIKLNNITVEFSTPLPHGECNTRLGWILAVSIKEDDYVFTFASDTQGCICRGSLNYITKLKPDFLVISGPPTYLYSQSTIPENTINLVKLMKNNATLVIDHHFLRDRKYLEKMESLRNTNKNIRIITAAEYMGREVKQLEAYRDFLWERKRQDVVNNQVEED